MANLSIKAHAERILKRLAGASERVRDEKVDQRDVEMRIVEEINRAAKLGLFENMKMGDKTVGSCYITTFKNVLVEYDNDLELAYCELPAQFIELPYGKGIDYVGPIRDRGNEFIPTDSHNAARSNYTLGAGLQGRVGYWIESGRLYFNRNIIDIDEVEDLIIRLVIADAMSLNRDSPLSMDPATMSDIADRIFDFFAGTEKVGKDITNNGVSDKK